MPDSGTKTKIIYVITKSNWGGAQRYVFDLATALPPDKFDVSVAAGGEGLLTEKLSAAGIRTSSVPGLERDINLVKEIISLFSLWKIFRQERPDIVHLSSSKAGGLGAFAARGLKTFGIRPKIIFTVHGWAFGEDRNIFERALIYFFQWLTALCAHRVITISSQNYRMALSMPFLKKNKLVLIPNGIGEQNFLAPAAARSELAPYVKTRQNGGRSPWLLTLTELTKNKGIPYLIEALKILRDKNRDFVSLIIGGGEDEEKLKKQISAEGLGGRVFLAGFLSEASKYLSAADIFVLPSVKEGLSYAIMEAMRAGVAVVASEVGGIPDLVKNGKNGILVPSKSPPALATALEKLLQDAALRKNYGERGREIIKTKFSLEKMRAATFTLYSA